MKNKSIKELLYRLNVHSEYSLKLLESAFIDVLNISDNNVRNIMLGSLLTALMTKNPTKDEVVTLLKVVFSMDNYNPLNRKKIHLPDGKKTITVVGSGKKGIKTINISTASAFLAASLGAYVVKPGSLSTSSITGSSDFMDIVGVNKNISEDESLDILEKCGFTFFSIEDLIPNFDKVYGGNFYAPHILSFGLAALLCPVKTDVILYGLAHPNVELSLNVLKEFDIDNALVVSSTDDNIHFIDEMGVFGTTRLIGTVDGVTNGKLLTFNPLDELGLPKYISFDIRQGKNKHENVKYILKALNGNGMTAHEDIICINCANILYLSDIVKNLKEGYILSKKAIKTGQGLEKLKEYILLTGGTLDSLEKLMGEIENETNCL